MSPRPYRLGQRRAANEQTRARIVEAARELLGAPDGFGEFTVEAVARQAGVARMTVYYQFGSKATLLEAIFEDLATRGGMRELPTAFQQADAVAALAEFVAVFCRFWASERLVIRRLQALTALDPDLQKVARDEWRRQGLRVLVQRLAGQGLPPAVPPDDAVDLLQALTSFQTFDSLAGDGRGPEEVAALVGHAAAAVLGLPALERGSR